MNRTVSSNEISYSIQQLAESIKENQKNEAKASTLEEDNNYDDEYDEDEE